VRRIDVVARGVASSFGAGLFLGLAPAASLAGRWLPVAVLLGVVVGGVLSIAERPLPTSPLSARRFGFALATLGRLAAAVALAGTVGVYLTPLAGAGVALLITAIALVGMPPIVIRVAAVVVVAGLLLVTIACFTIAPVAPAVALPDGGSVLGVLAAAGLLTVCAFGATGTARWSAAGGGAAGAVGPGGAAGAARGDDSGCVAGLGGAVGLDAGGPGGLGGVVGVAGTDDPADWNGTESPAGGVDGPDGARGLDRSDPPGAGGAADPDGTEGVPDPDGPHGAGGVESAVGGAGAGGGDVPGGAGTVGGSARWDRVLGVGVVSLLTLAVAAGVLWQLGAARLAISPAPLRAALAAADASSLDVILGSTVVVGCGFALLGVFRGLPAPGVPAVRVLVAVGVAVAVGGVLIPPVAALGVAAVLLLGDAAFRAIAG
jgi:hypothetical protein